MKSRIASLLARTISLANASGVPYLATRFFGWWLGLFNLRGVICWVIGAGIAVMGTMTYYDARPPGTLMSLGEDAAASISGDGKLLLLVKVDKHRFCPTETDRWLVHDIVLTDGKKVPRFHHIGQIPPPPVPLGEQEYVLDLDIPPGWDAKGTSYGSVSHYACGLGSTLFNPRAGQTGPIPINAAADKP